MGTTVLKEDFGRKKRQGGKMDSQCLCHKIARDLGKGFLCPRESIGCLHTLKCISLLYFHLLTMIPFFFRRQCETIMMLRKWVEQNTFFFSLQDSGKESSLMPLEDSIPPLSPLLQSAKPDSNLPAFPCTALDAQPWTPELRCNIQPRLWFTACRPPFSPQQGINMDTCLN